MPFDLAVRLIEIGLGFAILQRGIEHLTREPWPFLPQMVLALALLSGFYTNLAVLGLWFLGVAQLHRFAGPVNGGSDKMVMLILFCLGLVHLSPSQFWADMALSYLAVQLVLSYFVSGWVKLRNPEWRSGQALVDVFAFSAYPASEALRGWADQGKPMFVACWVVIGFEVLFPLSLFHPLALCVALSITAAFHLSNAICFGLNRFFWAWISAYPALFWFQGRMLGTGLADLL